MQENDVQSSDLTRRRVLGAGLGGLAGFGAGRSASCNLIGVGNAMAQGTAETVVYVSNAGSKEVWVLAMNRASGELDLIDKTPVPGNSEVAPAVEKWPSGYDCRPVSPQNHQSFP